eukprot:4617526-Amphidinium_carterae.1
MEYRSGLCPFQHKPSSRHAGDSRSIHDVYILDKYSRKIGEGSFGYVVKGRSKAAAKAQHDIDR